LLKFTGNVAYSAAVRLSSVLEVVLLLEEEEEEELITCFLQCKFEGSGTLYGPTDEPLSIKSTPLSLHHGSTTTSPVSSVMRLFIYQANMVHATKN